MGNSRFYLKPIVFLPLCVSSNPCLFDIVEALLEYGVHHTWMVDEKNLPKECVSIGDIFRVLVNHQYI